MRAYEFRHVIPFEETNLVGNVYFANHLRWQGHCREHFLRDHAPDILRDLEDDLRLVTTRCSCDYLAELRAFDDIIVRMRLGAVMRNRITLEFEYWRGEPPDGQLVATGEQQVACMKMQSHSLEPVPVPDSLTRALEPFMNA